MTTKNASRVKTYKGLLTMGLITVTRSVERRFELLRDLERDSPRAFKTFLKIQMIAPTLLITGALSVTAEQLALSALTSGLITINQANEWRLAGLAVAFAAGLMRLCRDVAFFLTCRRVRQMRKLKV